MIRRALPLRPNLSISPERPLSREFSTPSRHRAALRNVPVLTKGLDQPTTTDPKHPVPQPVLCTASRNGGFRIIQPGSREPARESSARLGEFSSDADGSEGAAVDALDDPLAAGSERLRRRRLFPRAGLRSSGGSLPATDSFELGESLDTESVDISGGGSPLACGGKSCSPSFGGAISLSADGLSAGRGSSKSSSGAGLADSSRGGGTGLGRGFSMSRIQVPSSVHPHRRVARLPSVFLTRLQRGHCHTRRTSTSIRKPGPLMGGLPLIVIHLIQWANPLRGIPKCRHGSDGSCRRPVRRQHPSRRANRPLRFIVSPAQTRTVLLYCVVQSHEIQGC